MITKNDLMKLIIDETKLLSSMIEVEDMENMEKVLDRQQALINEMTSVPFGEEEELERLLTEYLEMYHKSMADLNNHMKMIEEERQKNTAEMHGIRNDKMVHDKYSYFDLRD